jgi:hypothetical protein
MQRAELAVETRKLEGINVGDQTHQAIGDCHYWVGRRESVLTGAQASVDAQTKA